MPGLRVIRPADANETARAWREAIDWTGGPSMLVLSRQKLPVLDQDRYGVAAGLSKGAYILSDSGGDALPDLILIATGSEVHTALSAADSLTEDGIATRVVSMPSWEIFRAQSQEYRDEVLPPSVTARLAIEAGVGLGWREWTGDGGDVIAMTTFGASAPANELFNHFGFSVEHVVERARGLVGG